MSGRKAFPPGKSIGDLVARIQRDPPTPISELVPSIPKAIEDIISKSVEKQPEARYQDLAVMGREIARIRTRLEAAEQSERTVISVRPIRPSPRSSRRRPASPSCSRVPSGRSKPATITPRSSSAIAFSR